jgi:hypothetical protein
MYEMRQDVYCPQRLKDGRYIVYKLKSFLGFKWWTPIPSLYLQLDQYLDEKEMLESRLKVINSAIKNEEKAIAGFIETSLNSFNSFYVGNSKRRYANVAADTESKKSIDVTAKHLVPSEVVVVGIGDMKSNHQNNQQQQHNKPKS